MRVQPGSHTPIGATWDGAGVNFALRSAGATGVRLCLFETVAAMRESEALPLTGRTGDVWHGYVPGLQPGQLYGYRVDGPWDPANGLRFNAAKLLLDPYARAIGRQPRWHRSLFSTAPDEPDASPLDATDSAAAGPLGLVVHDRFAWEDDRPPHLPWNETAIYEAHVKGATATHPGVPEALRGRYLGLASPAFIAHLHALGVTAIELLPVHAHVDEQLLVARGLVNYWGYNTIGFFAPDARFATSGRPLDAIHEFKAMVRALHAAGIEVLLDVVFNHTAEGDHTGPHLSFRGIDNRAYYRLQPGNPARYDDVTGCGNTMDATSPATLALILDSLRYWVSEMHVDGFRFDLASALARNGAGFDPDAPIFEAVRADPRLATVKLIAEPWDAVSGGYQVGGFPARWAEWNGRYRDDVRRFWRGEAGALPHLATRLAGSSDLYRSPGRSPLSSINFATSHDGFTLMDLVSYNERHNLANGEDNRDGESHNLSWNGGVEGETDDAAILEARGRQRANVLATLAVSQGVPMLSGGDELGRTQSGNNNAYCQDSPVSWTDWDVTDEARGWLAFVRRALALRARHPVLRRQTFLNGEHDDSRDVHWLRPDGAAMTEADWHDADRRALAIHLVTVLVLINGAGEPRLFQVPAADGPPWRLELHTGARDHAGREWSADTLTLPPRSMAVLAQAAGVARTLYRAAAPLAP